MSPARLADTIDQKLVAAIGHPVRIGALEVLGEEEASPKALSEILRKPLSTVSYHVDVLNKLGLLDEVRTEKRRGATEHFFRAIPRSFVGHWDWGRVPAVLQGSFAATSLSGLLNHAVFALAQKQIAEAKETTSGWFTVVADDAGRIRLAMIARTAIAEAEKVQEESLRRSKASGARLRPYVFAVHLFAAGETP